MGPVAAEVDSSDLEGIRFISIGDLGRCLRSGALPSVFGVRACGSGSVNRTIHTEAAVYMDRHGVEWVPGGSWSAWYAEYKGVSVSGSRLRNFDFSQ